MNPTKAAPGSVFSSTFEVLNNKKKHHHRGPTVVKPSVLPLGGGSGKTSSDLKDKTWLQKQQKNQSCATGSGSQFKNKEKKNSSLPRVPFQLPQNPQSGGRKASLWWLYTLREQLRSWARAPNLWRTPSPRAGSGRKAAKDGKWWKFGSLLPNPAP